MPSARSATHVQGISQSGGHFFLALPFAGVPPGIINRTPSPSVRSATKELPRACLLCVRLREFLERVGLI